MEFRLVRKHFVIIGVLVISVVVLSWGPLSKAIDNRFFAVNSHLPDCDGALVGGYCWYQGAEGDSCTTVCATHGGYHIATRDYAGSSGTDMNCENVLIALGSLGTNSVVAYAANLGCYYDSGKGQRRRGSDPTVEGDSNGTTARACACDE